MTSKEALKVLYPNKTYTPYYTKSEKRNACKVIEKDLEVLEILKKKLVELNRVKTYTDYRVYNCYQYSSDLYLTEKEFNKIKEWLNDK